MPGLPAAWVPLFSNTYARGHAFAEYAVEPFNWQQVDDDIFCWECPWGVSDMFAAVVNPAYMVSTPAGLSRSPALDEDTKLYYDAVASGDLTALKASEPSDLAAQLVPETNLYSALGLDRVTGAPSYKILSAPYGAPRAIEVELSAPPEMEDDRGLVLSSTLGRAFVFGGTRNGAPLEDAWMLDIDAGTWTELALNEESYPGRILGAAYRPHDRAIYFLERLGSDLFLRRYDVMRRHPEGGAFRTLVRFPSAWAAASKYEVSIGTDLDLAVLGVVGSDYLIARFKVDPAQRITYEHLWSKRGNILTRPRLRRGGVSFSVATTHEPVLTMWRYDQAIQGSASQKPIIVQ